MTEEQQANPQAGEAGEGGQEPTEPKVFDAEYVAKLRREAAAYRREAGELKARVSDFEAQRMSEAEKLQAQTKAAQEAAERAQAELRATRAQAALATAASKVGVDVELVGRLVDVEFDEEGKPVDIETALQSVLSKWPHLKPAAAVPAATNPSRKAQLTLSDVRKMSESEINSRWDEVQKVLAAGT